MPKPKDRAPAVAQALQELRCRHPREAECRDFETGDYFCGDCGAVTTPWVQQTIGQRRSYELAYKHLPPAHQGSGG